MILNVYRKNIIALQFLNIHTGILLDHNHNFLRLPVGWSKWETIFLVMFGYPSSLGGPTIVPAENLFPVTCTSSNTCTAWSTNFMSREKGFMRINWSKRTCSTFYLKGWGETNCICMYLKDDTNKQRFFFKYGKGGGNWTIFKYFFQ